MHCVVAIPDVWYIFAGIYCTKKKISRVVIRYKIKHIRRLFYFQSNNTPQFQ